MYLDHSNLSQLFKLLLGIVTLTSANNAVSETGRICVQEDGTTLFVNVGITRTNYLSLSFQKQNTSDDNFCRIIIPVQLKVQWKDETQSIFKSSLSIENPPNSEPKIFLFGGISFENIKWLLVSVESFAKSDFIVIYENPIRQMISKQLQENHTQLSDEERKYIFQNYGDTIEKTIFSENHSKDLSDALRALLDLTLYMGNESNLGVLQSLDKSIFELSKNLLQGNNRARRIFQAYFNPRIESLLKKHGGVEKVMATEESSVVVKWCLYLEISNCLKYATYLMLEGEESEVDSEEIIFPQSHHVTKLNWKCAAIANEVTESINFPLWKSLQSQLRCNNETAPSCIYDFVDWENLLPLGCTKSRERFKRSLEVTSNSPQFLTILLATVVYSPVQYLEEFKIQTVTNVTTESLLRGDLKPYQFALIVGRIIYTMNINSWGGAMERRKQFLQEIQIFVKDNEKLIGGNFTSVILTQIDKAFFSLNNTENDSEDKIYLDAMLQWMLEHLEY